MTWRLVDTMQQTATTAGVSSYLDSAKHQSAVCKRRGINRGQIGVSAVLASSCLPVATLEGAEMTRARNSKQKTTSQNVPTTPSVALKMCPSVLWKKATALSSLRSFRTFQCRFSHYRSPHPN